MTGAMALVAAMCLSTAPAHAGKKRDKRSNFAAAKQLHQQREQEREQQRREQEQQRTAEQARLRAEIAKQQRGLAERQRQIQQMLEQQQQRAEAERQRQLERMMRQQQQARQRAEEAQRRQAQQIPLQQRFAVKERYRAEQPQRDSTEEGTNKDVGNSEDVVTGEDAAPDQKPKAAAKRPQTHNDRSRRRLSNDLAAADRITRTRVNETMRGHWSTIAMPSSPTPSAAPANGASSGEDTPAQSESSSDVVQTSESVEIAASQLSEAEIEKAKALGFEAAGETVLPRSNTAIQRLRAPAGMDSARARALLTEQMPLGNFAVNHTYRIFKDQEGKSDGPHSAECADEACMPAKLINWHSSLRSCTKDVRVGIIDTSFDLSHPAFRNLKVSSGQFLGDEQPSPNDWHGTAVLSLLAGDPRSGTPGLIPDAHFLLATAFKTDASGNASTDTIRLMAALEWMEMLDVQYVNMSFSGPRDPALERIIQRMRRKGIVFIAAAGNQGPVAPPSYPAAYPDVIAVTAVNRRGENYRHANRGDYIDVSAPGVDVRAALPDGKAGYRTGTSFAAPFVTAIIATDRAVSASTSAVWKPDLLSRLNVRDLGPPGRDPIYGQGLALAPTSCSAPDGSLLASDERGDRRKELPPPMGAGGPLTRMDAAAE